MLHLPYRWEDRDEIQSSSGGCVMMKDGTKMMMKEVMMMGMDGKMMGPGM